MTTLLILAVVYLFLANCVHRHRVRQLQWLIAQRELERQIEDPPEVVEPPTVTYTLN